MYSPRFMLLNLPAKGLLKTQRDDSLYCITTVNLHHGVYMCDCV